MPPNAQITADLQDYLQGDFQCTKIAGTYRYASWQCVDLTKHDSRTSHRLKHHGLGHVELHFGHSVRQRHGLGRCCAGSLSQKWLLRESVVHVSAEAHRGAEAVHASDYLAC